MKNRLNLLWNAPLRNPTQLALRRFERMPWGEMKSAFTESQESWARRMKDATKTHYDDLWKDD